MSLHENTTPILVAVAAGEGAGCVPWILGHSHPMWPWMFLLFMAMLIWAAGNAALIPGGSR